MLQQHQHQGYHHAAKKNTYTSGGGGHLMAPSGRSVGFNPGVAPAGALTPALVQALTALLATQGAGLGNFLRGLGGAVKQGILEMKHMEGLSALWTGLGANIARNATINASELASYDQVKQILVVFCEQGIVEVSQVRGIARKITNKDSLNRLIVVI
ncbi:hypothetical protein AgCh_002022 [Apium graveolens]